MSALARVRVPTRPNFSSRRWSCGTSTRPNRLLAMQVLATRALLLLVCHNLVSSFHLRPRPQKADATGLLAANGGGARSRIRPLRMSTSSTGADLGSNFALAVLGDLHLKKGDMEDHEEGRQHIQSQIRSLQEATPDCNAHMVSLGDLGSYGSAGTTESFELAKNYLDGFGIPYSLITGNHDLEGMDEFETDEENLEAWMKHFNRDMPQFCTQVGKRTLCVGLSTVRFRSAQFSSHEVFIPPEQIEWLDQLLTEHPESDGWKVLVFTHAPPLGCGLRVLQSVHVKNGCAWLNHSCSDEERRVFMRMCQKHSCIKAWFSGHFHLSHDYEDSMTMSVGTAFIQVGVIGKDSCRDERRQSRIVAGNDEELRVYSVNHHKGGELRLDATIKYREGGEDLFEAHGHMDFDHDRWFAAYTPQPEDGCYLQSPDGVVSPVESQDAKAVCWWHMADGKILGVHDGRVLEYDTETLSPLGIVIEREQLAGRDVAVVGKGQALVLYRPDERGMPDTNGMEIVHPNADGSYWRRWQRNKFVRTREKQREQLAKEWMTKYMTQRAEQPQPPEAKSGR